MENLMNSVVLHIFIDTSVLSNVPKRDSAAFGTIDRLALNNDIAIHVSEVSVREFVSQEEAHLEASIEQVRTQLRSVLRRLPPSEAVIKTVVALQQSADLLAQQLALSATTAFPNWLQRLGAVVHAPKPDHGARVLWGYFGGHPPFKSKKKREDFPDAFILASLQDVTATHKLVHAIIADNALKQAAASVEGVVVHASLDDFVKSSACQERIQKANVRQNIELLRTLLQHEPSSLDRIVNNSIASAIDGKEIESNIIPDDNSVATITSVDEPSAVKFDAKNAEYYGGGTVVVPFEATVEVLADYFIAKANYYSLSDGRAGRISISDSDWNDHYMAVQEYFTVCVSGTASVALDEALLAEPSVDEERLISSLATADGEIDEVSDLAVTSPSEDTMW